MFAGLFRHLTSEMLLLWDRGFFSYELWQQMTAHTVKVLARVKSGLISPIHHLADGSYLAKIYKSHYDRKKDRDGIAVRVDPLYARRPATGWSRRGACSDHQSF